MKNIFSEDEVSEFDNANLLNESELDLAVNEVEQQEEEEIEQQAPRAPAKKLPKVNSAYSLNTNEMNVIQVAMVQLDQARLYEMLLKHNLFEGVKANSASLKNVETELKDFILQRLQVLLGMKSDKKEVVNAPAQKVKVELPFNDTEIDFLKALAFQGTKGESAKSPSTKMIEAQSVNTIKPLRQQDTGLKKLNPMSMQSQKYEEEEEIEEEVEEEEEYTAPQPRRPIAKPVKARNAAPQTSEEIAREDIKNMKKRKPAHLMTPEELIEASKNINAGKKKSSRAMPMPDADALAMHYQAQQNKNTGNNINANLMGLLSQKLGYSTNQIQTVGDDND